MIKPGWFQSLSLNCSWYAVRHKASGNIIFNIQKGLSAIQTHLSGHRSNRSHCSLWSSGTCQTIIARVPHSSRERHQEQKQQAQRISLNLLHLKGLEVAKVFSTKEIYFGVIQYENRKKKSQETFNATLGKHCRIQYCNNDCLPVPDSILPWICQERRLIYTTFLKSQGRNGCSETQLAAPGSQKPEPVLSHQKNKGRETFCKTSTVWEWDLAEISQQSRQLTSSLNFVTIF